MSKRSVRMTINGREYSGEVEPRKLLTDFIRDDLGLTGTHVGCEHGVCGACTVLLNGEPVRSCLMFAVPLTRQVKTVEGLAPSATELHRCRKSFGSCTVAVRVLHAGYFAHGRGPLKEKPRSD
jgi:aerobic-type carbon monoxide dehydrogenase small subunit (CoxS/CutS family)